MPVLKDIRKTKEIELPGHPGSKVVIYESILLKDAMENDAGSLDEKDYGKFLKLLIKSWNFTDEENKPLPVTHENIELLTVNDLTFIVEQIAELSKEVKKN